MTTVLGNFSTGEEETLCNRDVVVHMDADNNMDGTSEQWRNVKENEVLRI